MTIDRGALGPTVIGKGSKIDNLVQIAHNVRIGEHCIVIAQVGIAGSKLGPLRYRRGAGGVERTFQIGNQRHHRRAIRRDAQHSRRPDRPGQPALPDKCRPSGNGSAPNNSRTAAPR